MKKLTFVASVAVAAGMTLSAFAGSAVADGTDFVVTADAGESFTNSTAIGTYTRLVKRGAGEVVLTAKTTAFTGAVVVEAGTLSITDLGAVGSGTPITVQNGATFYLKTPHTGDQTTDLFTGHDITIAGSGVGGAGALRYKQASGSGMADNLFGKITLSDDATVEVASRWGMYGNTKVLDLAGHTLTRIGGNNWMVYNHLKSTGEPGTIINKSGTMTLQGSVIIDPNVTVVVTNSTMGLWGVASDANIKGTIRLYSVNKIEAQAGTSKTVNHLGSVHVFGNNNSNGQLSTAYKNGARSMSIDGTLSSDSTIGIYKSGVGTLWVNGDVNQPGGNKNFTVSGGMLYFSGDKSRSLRLVQNGDSQITQEDGHTLMRMLRIANGGATSAAYRQLGGVLAVMSSDIGRIGESNGSRGFYTLEGGEVHFSNTVYMAEHKGSFGAFRQTGGLMELKRPANGTDDRTFHAGRGGSAVFVQTGGTNDTLAVSTSQGGGFQTTTNGTSEVTISGTGTLFRTTLFQMGVGNPSTNILNIKDGAVLKANRFRKHNSAAPATRVYVNADGGTLMPTFFSGWGAADSTHATFYKRSPDHLVVWKKGLAIDTSENSANSSAGSSSISFWFESPTGSGVESVALPTASGFIAANYIGIARVVFEDETGWGASAYAEYDYDLHKVTHIVVTSRGCDYSPNAKAYLESPDRTTRYACALTITSNAGQAGELVKRGAPTLNLFATNTITGGIAVESGMLVTATDGVIPSNTPVRVESGARLNLYNKGDITVSTFTGAGQVTNGAVTVTNAVRASCAELFAGKYATFAGNLTFAPGATFTITDPENLEAYKQQGSVAAFTAAAVNGTPRLAFEGGAPQGVKWSLFKKSDTTYNFGAVIGTFLLLK